MDEEEIQSTDNKGFWKLWAVILFILLGFLIIIVRLFFVQVLNSERYQVRAREQHESRIELSANRGEIFDKNGQKLVANVQGLSLAADPGMIKDKKSFAAVVSRFARLKYNDVLKKITKSRRSFVWLARGLMPGIRDSLKPLCSEGLIMIDEPKRIYYYGSSAAQIVGCTNVDNKGITGLEVTYDSLLKGVPGFMIMLKDGKGRMKPSADLPNFPAVNGRSLVLTIDIQLQQIVEYELLKGVERTKAEAGTVIAIEPATGKILSIASFPGYDPNNMLSASPDNMRNRAFTDVYEPGSTFKLFTAAAALEEERINPWDTVDGQGGYANFREYEIRDAHRIDKVTFREALEQSSNVVFATVAAEIPGDKFYKYLRDFGFGNTLGIDVVGEVSGVMAPAKKFNTAMKHFVGHGYGLSVTPLQIVSAYAAVANGGVLMKPYVVEEIKAADGSRIKYYKPEKIRKVITRATTDTLVDMLTGVVNCGTGTTVKIDGISIAGKTGTSKQLVGGQYKNTNYYASFAGFFPAEKPLIAMLVVLDKPRNGYYGGSTAGPIFRNIASRWISISPEFNLELEPDSTSDSVIMPNLKGFSSSVAADVLHQSGLKIFNPAVHDKFIIGHNPAAGSEMAVNTSVTFNYEDEILPPDSAETKTSSRIDVRGQSLRRAISILHKAGVVVKVKGSGMVRYQQWYYNNDKALCCKLICR